MKKLLYTLLFVLIAVPAFAADAVVVSPTQELVDTVVHQILIPFITAAAAIGIPMLIAMFRTKYKLDLAADTETMITAQALKAVNYAEEWGAAQIKRNIPTTGDAKYGEALTKLKDFVPTISDEQAKTYLTAALASVKGLGASKAVGQ